MDRRSFLRFLGLAPFAAKELLKVEIIENLTSAYDFRFGNSLYVPSSAGCVALELEHVRNMVPRLYEDPRALLWMMDRDQSIAWATVRNYGHPIY